MATQREEWLKLMREEPIDPELPICDPHHHLWDYPDEFPWRHYLLREFLDDIRGGHNIQQTVFLECGAMYKKDGPPELRCVGETEFVQGVAAQSASGLYGDTAVARGIIGFADLTLGRNVAPVLEAQIAASPNRFRGIRYMTAWDESPSISSRVKTPHVLYDHNFREGFACLKEYKLSFDAWLYHPQIPDLVDLARAFPETTIILNHVGGPIGVGLYAGRRQAVFQEWKEGIADLATCSNTVVKLGGLGMPLTGFHWHEKPKPPNSAELAAAMAPYFDWCIEKFGAERCMFESNFPVDKVSYSYTIIWNAFKRIAREYSQKERAALFHDTAVKVYRLK